jgi:uncharacterized protein
VSKVVVFVHGAGAGAYEADTPLVESLRGALGPAWEVRYPRMPLDDEAGYHDWVERIAAALPSPGDELVLVGHSVGGSVLLRYLCDEPPAAPVTVLAVLAAPFWGADDFWQWDEARLPGAAAERLSVLPRILLYHARDDEVVPFAHLAMYGARLPRAVLRPLEAGGHQFSGGLGDVARDIADGA